MTEYPYYCFRQTGEGKGNTKFYEGRYWNANSKGICIIAVVTEGIDWAAYIGADNGYREAACLQWTAENGPKLSAQDAEHIFPEIKLPYRL